jgi:hypothetical protein
MRPSTTKDNNILTEAYNTLSEGLERGSINGLAHGRTAGPLEEGEGGGKFAGAKDITEVINLHTQARSDEDYRLAVYEDLNDHLKYLFADVAYG